MTTEILLSELEKLPYGARLRRMYELGRESRSSVALQGILNALGSAADVYSRSLAISSCWGSEDTTFAEVARNDPSRTLRALALSVLVRFGTSPMIVTVLTELPHRKARRHFIRALVKARRTDALDTVLETLAQTNDPDLVRFLAYGSPKFVAETLGAVEGKIGWIEVSVLAQRHPEILTEALLARVQALSGRDPRLLELCNRALHFLSEGEPDLALNLVVRLRERFSLAEITLSDKLLRRRPQAVADLILASDEPIWVSMASAARALDTDRLVALARQHPEAAMIKSAWPELLPDQRRVLFEACGLGWRQKNGALPLAIAQTLPDAALRHAEARRCGELPALVTRPQERLPYAALLPWDEVKLAVEPFLKNPDAELRGLALTTLCTAAGYRADSISELLGFLKAREFEQDPVRLAMLTGLAELPPGRWQAEHLEALATILLHARNAADLSVATGAQAVALVSSLLKRFPDWAAPELAIWVKTRGQLDLSPLQYGLSTADIRRLEPHLMPVLRSWKTRERERHLVAAASALGKRLPLLGGLMTLLETLLGDTPHSYTAASILSLFADNARPRFAALVPELLAKDPSWITQQPVWSYLHRQRQDLLTDAFLGRRAFSGRFSTGKTRFILPVDSQFYRWTPRQQQLFARSLTELLVDNERPHYESFQAIKQYAALLDVSWEPLLLLAKQGALNPALRDTALRALARLDGGQGVDELIAALGDDRMRIAIYALRTSVLELPLPKALSLLREAPRRRVTVAKEVLRLLGDLPGSAGLDDILTWNREPELQRDLRVALVRALWPHREQEQVWPILENALQSGDAPLAAVALRAPLNGLSQTALHRQVNLIAQGISHVQPTIRLAALEAVLTVPNTDSLLTEPILARLLSPLPDERTAACTALIQSLCEDSPPLIGVATARVLPHRRALVGVVEALLLKVAQGRSRSEAMARAALDALSSDPLTLTLQARLAISALPEGELLAWLLQNSLTEDPLASSIAVLEARAAQQPLRTLESGLITADSPQRRRLALGALIGRAHGTDGWTEEIRTTLTLLCQDPSPLVAAAAQFTLPPETE